MQEIATIGANLEPLNFLFERSEVRVIVDEFGTIWFVCRDVFQALGVSWSGRKGSLKNYPERWVRVLHCQTPSGPQEVICISIAGVYKTLFASRAPLATAFAELVCEEILPAIVEHGFYGILPLAERRHSLREYRGLMNDLSKGPDILVHALYPAAVALARQLRLPIPDKDEFLSDGNQLKLEGL